METAESQPVEDSDSTADTDRLPLDADDPQSAVSRLQNVRQQAEHAIEELHGRGGIASAAEREAREAYESAGVALEYLDAEDEEADE